MSRVGKKPIPIPDKSKVEIKGQNVTITGAKGSLSRTVHADMTVALEDNNILVTRPSDSKTHRSLHGLTRALLNNMVVGTSVGYTKELEIIGVGYRAENQGKMLVLSLGFSHPIMVVPPDGVTATAVPKSNKILVAGIDKELVGETAAKIRGFRKPEPYKGKGVRYTGEYVRSKAGKSAVSA
ncbi:MAG: 50S ribosomal protein L6 [candidate division Zixibacteria bacterium]|nr:50S ribosomal protein L6 [candidate division Zixibacteria bacterium]MDH3937957.1 50S ribosomal protein L6 [candidate division Zixibacteria bacterium]MDH4034227.1 50S ribosomal protein L6 [candidate division Zixibacteria bacterium]